MFSRARHSSIVSAPFWSRIWFACVRAIVSGRSNASISNSVNKELSPNRSSTLLRIACSHLIAHGLMQLTAKDLFCSTTLLNVERSRSIKR